MQTWTYEYPPPIKHPLDRPGKNTEADMLVISKQKVSLWSKFFFSGSLTKQCFETTSNAVAMDIEHLELHIFKSVIKRNNIYYGA